MPFNLQQSMQLYMSRPEARLITDPLTVNQIRTERTKFRSSNTLNDVIGEDALWWLVLTNHITERKWAVVSALWCVTSYGSKRNYWASPSDPLSN